jgi:REP element-mobilizing transposase RayT
MCRRGQWRWGSRGRSEGYGAAPYSRGSEVRGWNLLAGHVRSNHVHAIVESETRPERIMNEFKSYASRELNRLGVDSPERKRWPGKQFDNSATAG